MALEFRRHTPVRKEVRKGWGQGGRKKKWHQLLPEGECASLDVLPREERPG